MAHASTWAESDLRAESNLRAEAREEASGYSSRALLDDAHAVAHSAVMRPTAVSARERSRVQGAAAVWRAYVTVVSPDSPPGVRCHLNPGVVLRCVCDWMGFLENSFTLYK